MSKQQELPLYGINKKDLQELVKKLKKQLAYQKTRVKTLKKKLKGE